MVRKLQQILLLETKGVIRRGEKMNSVLAYVFDKNYDKTNSVKISGSAF